jgi:hypothetical protein
MSQVSRRTFARQTLGSLLTFSLLETLYQCDAFADNVKPVAHRWVKGMAELGKDLKDQKLKQVEWQKKMEELYSQVDLPEILELIDFDKLTKNLTLVDNGVRSLRFSFKQVEGVPQNLVYGKQIFAFKKGRSVVPHGHNNMATAFLVLRGEFQGKHYDRLKDEPSHYIIKPTVDAKFGPGKGSTVSDYRDNIHWFTALSDEPSFILNIHAMGIDPNNKESTGRLYVDPIGEKLEGGLIRAKKISHEEAHKLYG